MKNFEVEAYADASYGTHSDGKSHTGILICVGGAPVLFKSGKQKLVSRSSTEAELIAADDIVPHLLPICKVIRDLGYSTGIPTLYQDNLSAIHLEENGRNSKGRSRHINIRYFYVQEQINNQMLKVKHLRTEEMLADFFTKPIEGHQFVKLRDIILGDNQRSVVGRDIY